MRANVLRVERGLRAGEKTRGPRDTWVQRGGEGEKVLASGGRREGRRERSTRGGSGCVQRSAAETPVGAVERQGPGEADVTPAASGSALSRGKTKVPWRRVAAVAEESLPSFAGRADAP